MLKHETVYILQKPQPDLVGADNEKSYPKLQRGCLFSHSFGSCKNKFEKVLKKIEAKILITLREKYNIHCFFSKCF